MSDNNTPEHVTRMREVMRAAESNAFRLIKSTARARPDFIRTLDDLYRHIDDVARAVDREFEREDKRLP